jgi:hypothetical protein
MRGFLIFLALALTIVVASPSSWMLLGMETSALPVTLRHNDGRKQERLIGPKAHWAPWASIPDGSRLTVRSWDGPSPPDPEMGLGDVAFDGEPQRTAQAYAAKLRMEGWTVVISKVRLAQPTLPPKPLEKCYVYATRGEGDLRSITAIFQPEPESSDAAIYWHATPPQKPIQRTSDEAC